MSYFLDPFLLTDLIKLKQKLGWDIFVETGTEFGNTLKILQWLFKEIYSCEIEVNCINSLDINGFLKNKNENGCIWNKDTVLQNVEIFTESSLTALPKILKKINHSNFFIYLDAHEDFTENVKSIPILGELECIAASKLTPLIIIHDFSHTNPLFRPGYKFSNDNIELGYNYVKHHIDMIYGIDNWDWKLNDESCMLTGETKVGAGYFWKKGLL